MLIKKLTAYLKEQQWKSEPLNGNENIRFFSMETENGVFKCIADVDNLQDRFIFLHYIPILYLPNCA